MKLTEGTMIVPKAKNVPIGLWVSTQQFLQNFYINYRDLAANHWHYEAITELTEPVTRSHGFKYLLSH